MRFPPLSVFVTGTDTGVGKSLVASALIAAQVQAGHRVVGMKPVASGEVLTTAGWCNEDVTQLIAAGIQPPPDLNLVCPYRLKDPLAPHLAAQRMGLSIEPEPIRLAFDRLNRDYDAVVVEGVGGFRVPFSDTYDSARMAQDLALPVVLVIGLRLGCLNHALLTVEAIGARGLSIAGWVANCVDPAMSAQEENIATLHAMMPGACLGVLPHVVQPESCNFASRLNLLKLASFIADAKQT